MQLRGSGPWRERMTAVTRDELLTLLADLRTRGSELGDVEVKAAARGSPERIWESLCSLANRPGGGVLILGVDDTLQIVGVGDLDQLQRDLGAAAANLEPPARIHFFPHLVDRAMVLVAEVPEVDPQFRPCYHRPTGLYRGAYLRVGDGDRLMTEYEIYLALSSRAQPEEDLRPVEGARLSDLDELRLDAHLAAVRAARPALAAVADDRAALLRALHIVARDAPDCPTVAGLLCFGRYPQMFFPSLVVTVTAYASDQPDPAQRLVGDVVCEGPLVAALEQAMAAVRRFMGSGTTVVGLLHERVAEYPAMALREAIVNAVAHRDYSRYAVGTQVQVRFFPDRVEVQNPGGLYGPLTAELLGDPGVQSTRNAALARLLEDLGPMENRGTGLATMAVAMRAAGLAPPEFLATSTLFRVTLRNEALLGADVRAWLSSLPAEGLHERQRLGLAFARRFPRIANREYRLLARVDSRVATRDLQDLVRRGLLQAHGTRGGTFYQLSGTHPAAPAPVAEPFLSRADPAGPNSADSDEGRALALIVSRGPLRTSDVARLTGLSRVRAHGALAALVRAGAVEPTADNPHAPNRRYRLTAQAAGPGR